LISVNPVRGDVLVVKKKEIARRDGHGALKILPSGNAAGEHGKTYRLCAYDELHGQKTWDLLEAMQPDPTRPDSLQWITSYASIYHKPGVPLYDLTVTGKAGKDERMYFSWYAADYCTDAEFKDLPPEERANPSMQTWGDDLYLKQQAARLPAHKYRRLHLNLPGLPEGSAFQPEPVMEAFARGITFRAPEPGIKYEASVDMSGGSHDDAVLAIGHLDEDERVIVDFVMNQGPPSPFDPNKAVPKFAAKMAEYRVYRAHGDSYGGETFRQPFKDCGVEYKVTKLSTTELYEALEPRLNAREVVLPDLPILEQQLLGLVWRGNQINSPPGEFDDWSNVVADLTHALKGKKETGFAVSVVYVDTRGNVTITSEAPVTEDRKPILGSIHPHEHVETAPRDAEQRMGPTAAGWRRAWHNMDARVPGSDAARKAREDEARGGKAHCQHCNQPEPGPRCAVWRDEHHKSCQVAGCPLCRQCCPWLLGKTSVPCDRPHMKKPAA